ncbi:ATP-binding protein [Algoriphagus sp. A40]|uniref:sensor histidine kinase n=1 Tax=Algoriphagus sp. A40 TaxID=1945863 RepID=UPI0014389E86|nr:ATP-binding protein [Algoriphagus sp. A40]
MLRLWFPAFLLTMGLLLIQSIGFAQNFKFNANPKGVNLPVQNVLEIEQDTLGRMWFSTTRGIVYSDGIQTHELPDTLIRKFSYRISILKDGDGIMWLYNANGTPVLMKAIQDGWEEIEVPGEVKTRIHSIIGFFTTGKSDAKHFFLDAGRSLVYWKEGQKEKLVIDRESGQTGELISVLEINGEFMLNFKYQTLKFDGEKLIPYTYRGIPLPSTPFLVKQSPHSGEFYFLGKDYLAKGPKAEFPTEIVSRGFSSQAYMHADYFSLEFAGENVFFHFNSHLLKFNPSRNRPVYINLFELFNTIYLQTIFLDREGILWVGTNRGMANNNSQVFQNYGSESKEFLGEELTAISDLGNGSFLFGFNNGIQIFSRTGIKTIFRDDFEVGLPNHRIVNFSKDNKHGVWFSASWGGVGHFDTRTEKITLTPSPDNVNISAVQVEGDSLLMVANDRVFMAPLTARGNQLFKRELTSEIDSLLIGSPVFFRKAGKLKNGKIIVLRASKLENLYPMVETSRYILAEGYDYLEMPDGSLLLGTEFGLKIYREGYLGYYIHLGKPITNAVFALLRDRGGNILAGTDNGIFILGEDKISHFREKNGLVGNEINRGALVESSTGRILIGTQKGLSIFFPEESFYASGAPFVFLSSVKLGEDEILGKVNPDISFSQNSLEVSFLSPAFNESRELWIHYRLKDQENSEWTILKNPGSNQLFFSNLPAGDYQFELKASYDGEIFSETVSSGPFVVLAPFYLQIWFIVSAILFLLGLGVLINMFFRQLQNLGVLQTAVDKESKGKVIAEQQFKNVWESSQDGMLLTLKGQKILTANPAFAAMMKSTVTELEGQPISFLFKDESMKNYYLDILLNRLKFSPEKGISMEAPIEWKTGLLDMEVFAVQLEHERESKGLVLSVFKDITAQKSVQNKLREAKEKAEEANRFKSSLLSNISHEIRTPLNGIIGGAEHIMMIRKNDSDLHSQLDIILQSGERLLGTINSLLDIAKIEANKMPVVYTKTDVKEFLETIIRPLRDVALRKGLDLEFQFLSPAFQSKVDRRFLEMILNNLVSNATKYTEEGLIKVTCQKVEDRLLLEVSDTGVGISLEFQRKMFDPFEQESKGNDRMFEGTGLGLSITRNLVHLMGGTIQVWSAKNSGTRVLVEIPLSEV